MFGILLEFVLWTLFPFSFFSNGDIRKASSLAEQALEEPSSEGRLSSLRESVMLSPLYRDRLRFNSVTMHVPEDEAEFLLYFRQTFLPGNQRQLAFISSRKFLVTTDLLMGLEVIIFGAILVSLAGISDSLFLDWFQPPWIFYIVVLSVALLNMIFYPFFLRKATRKAAAYVDDLEMIERLLSSASFYESPAAV